MLKGLNLVPFVGVLAFINWLLSGYSRSEAALES